MRSQLRTIWKLKSDLQKIVPWSGRRQVVLLSFASIENGCAFTLRPIVDCRFRGTHWAYWAQGPRIFKKRCRFPNTTGILESQIASENISYDHSTANIHSQQIVSIQIMAKAANFPFVWRKLTEDLILSLMFFRFHTDYHNYLKFLLIIKISSQRSLTNWNNEKKVILKN